ARMAATNNRKAIGSFISAARVLLACLIDEPIIFFRHFIRNFCIFLSGYSSYLCILVVVYANICAKSGEHKGLGDTQQAALRVKVGLLGK
ncbi:MAG TPA: hypothetical protein VIM59_05945, partial [Cellvibrio sp.]